MSRIRVLIADGDSSLGRDVAGLLLRTADVVVVGECSGGQDAITEVARLEPDVVLLDLDLPGAEAADAARLIIQCCPTTAVLVVTPSFRRDALLSMMRAGAGGYVMKDVDSATLVQAIRGVRCALQRGGEDRARLVAEMEDVLQSERDHLVLAGRPRRARSAAASPQELPQSPGDLLTTREREVLGIMAAGASNAEIARNLFISEKTVKNHATSIFRKLSVDSRQAASCKAQRLGWVEQP